MSERTTVKFGDHFAIEIILLREKQYNSIQNKILYETNVY